MRRAFFGALATFFAALLPALWLWGFTVDDALVSCRVAARIAQGFGYRFNRGGPVVDAVTPLGFAYLLAPFAKRGPMAALHFAKWFGVVLWLSSAAWLGARTARGRGGTARLAVLIPVALCAPLAAWSVAGMETGLVLALATLALGDRPFAPLAAGLAAALRPELLPWAVTIAVGGALAASHDAGVPGEVGASGVNGVLAAAGAKRAVVAAVVPALVVALVRVAAFGHAVPLSFYAKPSDFAHGAFYVLAALLWTGAPILVVAPWAFRRLDAHSRAILAALGVHCCALVLAGGDWMALFRLFVPILPGVFLVGARLVDVGKPWASWTRVVLASGISATLLFDKGVAARGVLAQRTALIDGAAPLLAGRRSVAALDVGWVGAATDADLVDLAGITDEAIARLRGGHTSKRTPEGLLRHRGVDALVLLTTGPVLPEALSASPWARAVEARVAREAADLGFEPRATLKLAGTTQSYVVLTLQNAP